MVKTESEPTRSIFVVDDHPLIRAGIRESIDVHASLTLIGESDNADDTLEKVQKLKPDLLIVDLTLRGRSGLELIKDLRKVQPEVEILVFSMHGHSNHIERRSACK